jgi:hypothetical protein
MIRATTFLSVVALTFLGYAPPAGSSAKNEALAEACQVILKSAGFRPISSETASRRVRASGYGRPQLYARGLRVAFEAHRGGLSSCVIHSDGKFQAAIGAQHAVVLSYAAEEMKRRGATADEIDAFLLPVEEFVSDRDQRSYRSRSGIVVFLRDKNTEVIRVESAATKRIVVTASVKLRSDDISGQ